MLGTPSKRSPDAARVYRRLLDNRDIRLVTIQPASWGEPIRCSLSHHSLDQETSLPVYSALSYVWGSPKATELIFLQGAPWHVTVNLSNALHFLRDEKLLVQLWIDALCINRQDIHERGKQVRLMTDIFSGANEVIVYWGDGRNHRPKKGVPHLSSAATIHFFGDERDEAHLALFWAALSEQQRSASSFQVFCLLRVLGDDDHEARLGLGSRLSGPQTEYLRTLVEELRMMLLSPWWQRIWVVQEMTVPRKVVVRYGNIQAPWDMFVVAASSRFIQGRSGQSLSLESDSEKVLQLFSRYIQNCERLRNQWTANRGAPLLELLQSFSYRQASDERDKVYALLNLAEKGQRALVQPNYFLDVATVYRDTAIALIRHTGRLSPWTGDMLRKNRIDLPSWVPDWSAVYEMADQKRAQAESKYNACDSWGFTVVGSRTEYWAFVYLNMRRLLHDIQASNGTKLLPVTLKKGLHFYSQQLSHHRASYYRARDGFQDILKYYKKFNREWPSVESQAMHEFHTRHVALLDMPMEQGATRDILQYCHTRLWPGEVSCDTGTCIGHGWRPRDIQLVHVANGRDDFALLRDLVWKAEVQYGHYLGLAELSILDYRKNAVGELCEDLQQYCVLDDQTSPRVWIRRLFSRSPLLYGKIQLRCPVIAYTYATDPPTPDSVPFWTGSGTDSLLPALPELTRPHALNTLLATANHNPDRAPAPAEAAVTAAGAPAALLSLPSFSYGRVRRVLGPKLMAWTDTASAHATIAGWLRALPLRGEPGEVRRVAGTLVGGMRFGKRLGGADEEALGEWFRSAGFANGGEEAGEETRERAVGMEGFDEACAVAVEGRVLFEMEGGALGLGPGSMADRDEVRVLPGGRTWFVLRRMEGESGRVKGGGWTLVGDCYLDSEVLEGGEVELENEEAWDGGLPEELLYNGELGPTRAGGIPSKRERIYLF